MLVVMAQLSISVDQLAHAASYFPAVMWAALFHAKEFLCWVEAEAVKSSALLLHEME